MPSPIKILILEDVSTDAELAEIELTRALGRCTFLRVDNRSDFISALNNFQPNLVVSDYKLPSFDGLNALRVTQEVIPKTPFIILTGSINEDTAVECMKAGAWDYVIKEHIKRLGAAARSALELHDARTERQQAATSLRHSEQRLRVAQRMGKVGHWELDLETQRLHWSDAVFEIYGRDPSLGPPSLEQEAAYYSADTFQEMRSLATRAIETGESFEFTSQLRRHDGTVVDIATIGSTMTDEQGRVTRLLGTVQDITERNRADARIRHLNSLLEALRNINQLIIRERDPNRLIQQTCNMLVKTRGFRGAWILLTGKGPRTKAWAQAGFKSDVKDAEQWLTESNNLPCLQQSYTSVEPLVVLEASTVCGKCPLDQRDDHSLSAIAKLAHAGKNMGVIGVSFPLNFTIDEEEKSLLVEFAADLAFALFDIELEQQRNRFAQIVSNSKEAMALVGPDLVYLDANAAYGHLLGASPIHLIGRPVSQFVGDDFFAAHLEPRLRQCFLGDAIEFDVELPLPNSAQPRYLSAIYSPCFAADGTITAVAVCIRDITAERLAASALLASENRYRLLADNAGIGIGYWALDGTLLYFNAQAAMQMGDAASSFVGKSLHELYGDELAATVLDRMRTAASIRVPRTYEDEVRLGNEPSWFLSTYAAMANETGQLLGVQVISHDITERKRAEVALGIERDNLAAFLAAAPAAILVLNHAQKLVHCNSAAEELLDVPLAQTFGKRCGDLLNCVHRLEGPRGCGTGFGCESCPLFEIVRNTLECRNSVREREICVELARRPPGDFRWFVANAGPLTLSDGPGAVLALHDITERKRTEEKLRFQNLLLESQNEASIDGILINDHQGKLLWHNRRFAELFSVPPEELKTGMEGAAMTPILAQLENPPEYRARLLALSVDQTTKTRNELRLKDGRTLDHFSTPILGDNADFLGRVCLFRDISIEKQLSASVTQSDRLASMGMLAAGVAHEINNPLSYILYNLESLADDLALQLAQSSELRAALTSQLSPQVLAPLLSTAANLLDPEMLQDMTVRFKDALSGTRRIKDIARGLGTFSRVEKDRIAPIEVTRPIESALSIAFNEIKYRAHVEKDFETKSLVLASDGQLSQVFLNLLINAAHSMPVGNIESNRITIRTWERENEVFASVEDTGCGIPPENLERIFDPFFTTKPIGVGSGLGLNIVRSIIANCSGSIQVSSKVGKGTLFVIRLPMAISSKPSSMLPPPLNQTIQGPKGRLLIVDDESQIRSALSRILSLHRIVQAQSGEEACAILTADQNFDVILCDVMMSKMSGVDLHLWLAQHHPKLARRVMFITGGAFASGASTYLEQLDNLRIEKPFESANLQKAVSDCVAASQSEGT